MGGAFKQEASVDLSRKAMRMEPTITRCQAAVATFSGSEVGDYWFNDLIMLMIINMI